MQQDRYQPTASSGNQSWNKIAWTLVALALVVIVAVAISAGQDKQPIPTKPIANSNRPTTSPDVKTAMTRASFFTTWNKSSEYQRDNLCFELKAFGKAKTAAALKQGAGGSDSLDWNLAADLLASECGKR